MIGAMEPLDFKRMLDFSRLMEGENRDSRDPEDIRHWTAVYTDLLEFKQKLLGETKEHIRIMPETAPELGGNDLPFLVNEMARLRQGLKFWQARRAEPGPPG
jgi:hypothetical protein